MRTTPEPFVNKREVKDRKDDHLTQEPEMIKAFRDTWELGIHSYLTYLRDRLLLGRQLLHESGSVFVQIGDANVHRVRALLDELFGAENCISLITLKKTAGQDERLLNNVADYILWYAKSREHLKFRALYTERETNEDDLGQYNRIQLESGQRRNVVDDDFDSTGALVTPGRPFQQIIATSSGHGGNVSFPIEFRGRSYTPTANRHWSTHAAGFARLIAAERIVTSSEDGVRYVRFFDDFVAQTQNNVWTNVGTATKKTYVVETGPAVVQRCLLMTTDPGDLVLDPTCGSGTTAFVAEKWGRRWITCDTSRVATTLAKQRLATSSFDYYELKYPHEGLKGGFVYKTVPHVTLKSIANNVEIDELYERHHPAVELALGSLNVALSKAKVTFEVAEGERAGETLDFGKSKTALREWEVPFELPEGWPNLEFDAFHNARRTMLNAMDNSIGVHAEQEVLYDQPRVDKTRLRITGPFTVEAVPFPTVMSLDETRAPQEADVAIARSGESSRQHQWRDELLRTGIRGKGGQILKLASLETMPDLRYIHGSGSLADSGDRLVVSFGPEHGALEQRQVEMAMREASDLFPRPKMIVFCAFAFDPEAAKDIDQTKGIVALKAQMNTDLLTEDLKKARASNQSFWLMGQPDVELKKRKDNLFEVEVRGFDYFDTTKGELVSGGKSKIALWMLDTDYDERSLLPRQVFFPMAGPKDGWYRLRKDLRAELDETRLAGFHGTVSLPFEAGENKKVAVKVVDDRGIESLKILPLD